MTGDAETMINYVSAKCSEIHKGKFYSCRECGYIFNDTRTICPGCGYQNMTITTFKEFFDPEEVEFIIRDNRISDVKVTCIYGSRSVQINTETNEILVETNNNKISHPLDEKISSMIRSNYIFN